MAGEIDGCPPKGVPDPVLVAAKLHDHMDLLGLQCGNGIGVEPLVALLDIVGDNLGLHPCGLKLLGITLSGLQVVSKGSPDLAGLNGLIHAGLRKPVTRKSDVDHLARDGESEVGGLDSPQVGSILVGVEAGHLSGGGHLHAQGRLSARQTLEAELRHLDSNEGELLLLVAQVDDRLRVLADDRLGSQGGEIDVKDLAGEWQ
mmetsp:Transcript_41768/g.65234  ORF Transcript_41768/g.65234 Transcript_41768/m.65234 type:complete len:202 (-) Transcript_41768:958-1563(-)